nr:cation diffusion facilitator family transporter [Bacilli bacterium]
MNKLTYTVFTSFMGNTFLSIVKIIAGFVGRSMSLIVDGVHTFADQSLELVTMSNSRYNKNNGLKHFINLFTGTIVLGLGLSFIYLAISRGVVIPRMRLLGISLFTIVFKYVLSTYLMEKGKLYNNSILVNDAKQSNKDVLSSVIVFIALILMTLSDKVEYFKYADMAASIIVSLFVIYTGFVIISRDLTEIFGTKVDNLEYINSIKTFIENNRNVMGIKSMVTHKYGPYYEVRCDIILDNNLTLKFANEVVKYLEYVIRRTYKDVIIIINIA